MPRLAKVVNVLAIRKVKQGTETARFRIGSTLHSCQYVTSWFNSYCSKPNTSISWRLESDVQKSIAAITNIPVFEKEYSLLIIHDEDAIEYNVQCTQCTLFDKYTKIYTDNR